MPATTISGPIGTTKYYGMKPQTPYDYYLNGQGGYGVPPPGATTAGQKTSNTIAGTMPKSTIPYDDRGVMFKDLTPEQMKKFADVEAADRARGVYSRAPDPESFISWQTLDPEYGQYVQNLLSKYPGVYSGDISELKKYSDWKGINSSTTPPVTTTAQNPIPSNWMDTVNKEIGKKYIGATPYGSAQSQSSAMLAADTPPGTLTFDTMTNGKPDWFVTGTPSLPTGNATMGTSPIPASPAGNNITSGIVNPTTNASGTNLAITAPNTGTGAYSPDMSFLNPASGTAGTKRKTGANKYFNQQWFGGKQLA